MSHDHHVLVAYAALCYTCEMADYVSVAVLLVCWLSFLQLHRLHFI